MDTSDHEAVVGSLSPPLRKIYNQISLGPTTSRMLRDPLGRTDGMTTELRKLQELGLIREVGKAPRTNGIGIAAKQYIAVPPGQVEDAQAAFAARKPTKKRRAPATRIAELRSREGGDYGELYATRRRMIEASRILTRLAPMVDWECAPMEELAQVAEEAADLRDAVDALIARLLRAEKDAGTRATIEKLLATNGRTPEEIETARALAAKLKARL